MSDFFSVTNLWMKEMKLNWATEEINYYWFVLNRWYNLLEYFKSKLHTVWVLEQNLVENSTASWVITSEMESYRLETHLGIWLGWGSHLDSKGPSGPRGWKWKWNTVMNIALVIIPPWHWPKVGHEVAY